MEENYSFSKEIRNPPIGRMKNYQNKQGYFRKRIYRI